MKQRADKIPERDKVELGEALDRLIAFGEATGLNDEIQAWKAERAKLAPNATTPKSP